MLRIRQNDTLLVSLFLLDPGPLCDGRGIGRGQLRQGQGGHRRRHPLQAGRQNYEEEKTQVGQHSHVNSVRFMRK
jgi:hypothetical protein